jgi:hypothetical protein
MTDNFTFPQARHCGHDYLIVPSELLERVSTTEPPEGWWTEEYADQLAEGPSLPPPRHTPTL